MEPNQATATMELPSEEQTAGFDPAKTAAFNAQLESEQNLPLAVCGGFIAAILGAAVWAAVTVATEYQIGWMAVGVGFVVGIAVRLLGKGVAPSFGMVGAGFALLGCVLGNLMSTCGFIAIQESTAFLPVALSVLTQPATMIELLKVTFSPMDILFYGLALYTGYKFAFRHVTPEELEALR